MNNIKGHVFIITFGRTGSTLLQGLLNMIPGVLIRGENDDFFYHLFHAFCSIQNAKRIGLKIPKNDNPKNPWFGYSEMNEELFIETCKSVYYTQLIRPSEKIEYCGFKEIRFLHKKDIHEYIQFMDRVFPKSKFLLHYRNIDDVLQSGWWAKIIDKTGITNEMKKFVEISHSLQKFDSSKFRVTQYEKITDYEYFRCILDFLGLNKDIVSVSNFDVLLTQRHSS